MVFRFDECELDLDAVELRVGGQRRAIEPQVFDVLAFLLRHHDRMVSKEELLDEVWHHRFVTESAISSRIKSVRRAIGDDGRAQRLIRTVHGRGYQFVGDVRREEPAATAPAVTGVPTPATATIGRTDDVERVLALLGEARIVTLLGPGGVGKTRLAVEVALRCSTDAPSDTWFVDLTKERDHRLVAGLVGRELGVHTGAQSDPRQILEEAVRGRRLLVVLDNFEHVIDAASLVGDIVRWSPGTRALVTSRTRLRIAGEHVYDVAPLPVERSDGGRGADDTHPADAVALFEQAATAADPDFRLAPHLADVVTICRMVDGLPLAIELAAGHVRTLPPALLRTRLGAVLGSPAGAARDAPSRQRTVPAMIDWSLELLGTEERRLFSRLGVFSGAVSLEAVEQVCGLAPGDDVVGGLTRLVDQSLVRRVAGTRGEPRFVLLELLRERARELLAAGDEEEAVWARHAEVVAAFLEDLEERRWSEASDRWIDLITELLGEVRAAHAWAEAHGDARLAARITANLGAYWHREGHHTDGRRWTAHALAHAAELDAPLVARLHLTAGFMEWPRSQLAARKHWDEAIVAFRTLGDDRYLAYTLGLVPGTYVGDGGRYDLAIGLCDEGIALARRVGDRPLIAQALNVKGELARVHGDDDLALAVYEEGKALAAAAGDEAHLSVFLANLMYIADHRGDYEEARRLGCDALRLCWSLGRRMMAAWTISEMAGPELGLGRPERGALLVGASDEALRVLGTARHPGDVSEHDRVLDGLRAALGDERLGELLGEGGRLSLDDAVALALTEPEAVTSEASRRDRAG
jgi:predicted ATPase/DNA-binding winged helix-turn-helix (wHTH) protein